MQHWSFAEIYLVCGLLAAAAIASRFTGGMSSGRRLFSFALCVPLILVYLSGMHRSAGMDFETYSAAYVGDGLLIPDLGYTAITALTRSIGIDFSTFLFLQGAFTLAVLWRVANALKADPVVVVVVYLLHLAVGRDLSQSRIGLAVAIFLLGHTTQHRTWRVVLYACAATVHITSVVLMLVWAWAKHTMEANGAKRLAFVYLPVLMLAASGATLLRAASWVDPRVELYLNWDEVAFGAPLESFGALWRTGLVVLLYLLASRALPRLQLKHFLAAELAGAAILIAFADFSIFAARLSNVAVSMYPFGLGTIAFALQTQRVKSLRFFRRTSALTLTMVVIMATLILRPGTFSALREVVPTVSEWVHGRSGSIASANFLGPNHRFETP